MNSADASNDPLNKTPLNTLVVDKDAIESRRSKEEAPVDVKIGRPRNVPIHLWEVSALIFFICFY